MTTAQKPAGPTRSDGLRQELLAVARALDEASAALADLLEERPVPLTGNLQEFPRPSAGERALTEGLEALVEESARASAILGTLAAAEERGFDPRGVLLGSVLPYLTAYREFGGDRRDGRTEEQAEQRG